MWHLAPLNDPVRRTLLLQKRQVDDFQFAQRLTEHRSLLSRHNRQAAELDGNCTREYKTLDRTKMTNEIRMQSEGLARQITAVKQARQS